MIALIDYGAGNLHSVANALAFLGCRDVRITGSPRELSRADAAILPGVGSFGHAMECLQKSGLVEPVREFIGADKPFLGICLGLHMLFEGSEESPGVPGLGILQGQIRRIPKEYDWEIKIPHMGWNSLTLTKTEGLYRGIEQGAYVYFLHSYYVEAKDRQVVSARTEYGIPFDVSVQRGNLHAVQFHPEKSGRVGLRMLQNFTESIAQG